MRNVYLVIIIFCLFFSNNIIFAQEEDDDLPYLTAEDIAAIEMSLPSDVPEYQPSISPEVASETKDDKNKNEISRLNTTRKIYHLLILDRSSCSSDADITGIHNSNVLYNYKDGPNGYLIAIYTSSPEGPVFPQLPDKSYIIVNFLTVRKNSLAEYFNSSEFRRFVTNRKILSEIKDVLKTKL
jgi:hypothetical protein